MSITKLVFLTIVTIVFFNYFNNTDDNRYDGSLVLPINTKILAFGDDITYGYGVDRNESYPSVLSSLLQNRVINAGKNSETTAEGLKRLPKLLKEHKPQILIICEGENDLKRGRKYDEIEKNLAKMIELAQKEKIFVVLIGAPTVEYLRYNTVNLYYVLAKKYDILLDAETLAKILNNDKLKTDETHPNAKGYEILSNALANSITANYTPTF